jgi:hypothetical protein
MLPPICAVCGKDFRDNTEEGGLVEFAHPEVDEDDMDDLDESAPPDHPDYVQWFCLEHIEEAEKLSYLESKPAISRLKRLFSA